jgi:hypothetical protein
MGIRRIRAAGTGPVVIVRKRIYRAAGMTLLASMDSRHILSGREEGLHAE